MRCYSKYKIGQVVKIVHDILGFGYTGVISKIVDIDFLGCCTLEGIPDHSWIDEELEPVFTCKDDIINYAERKWGYRIELQTKV